MPQKNTQGGTMRQKKAKRIRKMIYGDYSHNLHKSSIRSEREMGLRLRKQYRAAKKETK